MNKKEQQRPLQLCLEICCHNAVLMEMKKEKYKKTQHTHTQTHTHETKC